MKKGKKIYEGKAKIVFATSDKNLVIQHFKDDATAFNNQKKDVIDGKGILNNRISEHILTNLNQVGIKNHLIKRLNMREQLVQHVEIIEDGTVLEYPLVEYCLKNDELGDPLISKEHILAFKWMDDFEIDFVNNELARINDFLQGMFRGVGIKLVDFKVEFGRLEKNGKKDIILADEISPDTCRLWDATTDKKLDKDRFRKDLGNLVEGYQEVARRLDILHEQSNIRPLKYSKPKAVKFKKK